MITLTHGYESISLGPSGVFTERLTLGNVTDSINDTKNRVIDIDGVLHTLYEDRLSMTGEEIHLKKG